jgi:hypothetical protein
MTRDAVCRSIGALILFNAALATVRPVAAEDYTIHRFERIPLTDVYYSEGANFGDLDGDGIADVVYGPHWYAGPDYKKKREIYPAKPQNLEGYSDHFFHWIYDFDRDGHNDIFVVGFPGTPAFVYRNPGPAGFDSLWPKHQVFDWVSNESPHFTQLVGDDTPELVCTRDGFFGYATINKDKPLEAWAWHAISEKIADQRFGHGLGVGDVNSDGRLDVLFASGWLEQPEKLDGDSRWKKHDFEFANYGGAEMYAYDVDGDGDSDVITSLRAHDFGLAWYEQIKDGDEVSFKKHLIMGDKPEQNKYGLLFTEPHSVNLVDMDGDGLKDIVTGKTYWSHHRQSPLWDAGAVVYWFKLVRGKDGIDWVPYLANGDTGIGRQLSVGDLNADKLPDIVVGGMKGGNVLIHRVEKVDQATWEQAQPKAVRAR